LKQQQFLQNYKTHKYLLFCFVFVIETKKNKPKKFFLVET